jgi:hypothetical protein
MGTRNGEQLTEVSPSEWQKSMLFGSPPCSPQMPTSSVGRTLRPFCAPAKHPRDRRRPGADMGRASIRSRKRSGSLCAIQLPSGRCASAALRQRHVRLCDLPNRAHPSRRPARRDPRDAARAQAGQFARGRRAEQPCRRDARRQARVRHAHRRGPRARSLSNDVRTRQGRPSLFFRSVLEQSCPTCTRAAGQLRWSRESRRASQCGPSRRGLQAATQRQAAPEPSALPR